MSCLFIKIEFCYETPPYARSNPTATTSDAGESTYSEKKGRPDPFQPIQNNGELLGQLKTSKSRDKYAPINETHDLSIVSKKLRKPLQNNDIFQSQDKNDRIILQPSKSSYDRKTAAQESLPKDLEKQKRTANHSQEKSKGYKRSQEKSKINIAFSKYKIDSKTSQHKVTPAKQQDHSIQSQERHKLQISSQKHLENIKQPQAESYPKVKSQNPTDIRKKHQDQYNDSKISVKQSGIPLKPHLPSIVANVPSKITEIVDAEVYVNNNQTNGPPLHRSEKK
ncbi:hypothetical protein PoB_000744800 [Plakobranchus ocellatus]|uniref:Uncharacterized protein n=1 Tax=Plakobranchus ocellatus TaxID=259542 RepID=A0AAV3YEP3_9GAST|nr:hypothetical protein PoB_000744800 [Plakobranchus ocellatus]